MKIYVSDHEKYPDFALYAERSVLHDTEVELSKDDFEAWKAAIATIRRIEDVIKEQLDWDD